MLLAIALQESRLKHRKQIGGPARGFWQFELGGGIRCVLHHEASKPHIHAVLDALAYDHVPETSYVAIEHNDVLACAYARLLLWTDRAPLPALDASPEIAWQYYLRCWRPGRPHRASWDKFHSQSIDKVIV